MDVRTAKRVLKYYYPNKYVSDSDAIMFIRKYNEITRYTDISGENFDSGYPKTGHWQSDTYVEDPEGYTAFIQYQDELADLDYRSKWQGNQDIYGTL